MDRMLLVFCLVFISVCFDGARSSLPPPSKASIGLYLTKKGADYANVFMVNKTKSTMEGEKVPPVSISKSIWWNTIRLSLANSKIRSVSLGATSIKFQNGFIVVLIKINSAEVAGEYNYNGGFFGSGIGTYVVKLRNVWITKYLSLGVNAKGKPFLINGRCSNWIEDTSTEFNGGSSFIINLLVSLVKSSVNNDVRKKICTSINEAIDKRGKVLPSLFPEIYNSSRVQCAQIQFPILQQPLILTNYIEFLIEGRVSSSCYQLNNSSQGRGVRHIKHIPNPSKMIGVVVSDRFINSLVDLHYKAGLMKSVDIQSNDLLDPLRVALHLTSPPRVNTTINSSVAVFEMKANLTTTSAVDESQTLSVDLEMVGDFYLEEENKEVSGKVRNIRIKPFFIGNIPEKIKSLVLPVLKTHNSQIVIQINGFFNKMAPIPMLSYVYFTNKEFISKEGYTVFESDVKV